MPHVGRVFQLIHTVCRGSQTSRRAWASMCRAAATEPVKVPELASSERMGLTLCGCMVLDLIITIGLCGYRPLKALDGCAFEVFALGSSTVDVMVFTVLRVGAYAFLAKRFGGVDGSAEKVGDFLSHASLAELAYALTKGVSRALGARSRSGCHDTTEAFDAACGSFAVFARARGASLVFFLVA